MAKGPTLTDWAYAAGFVDGEGCIAIVRAFVPRRERYYYSVQIVVSNRDREVFDWMHGIQRKVNHRGNAGFVKQAMHSPRRINRERAVAAAFGV